MLLRGELCWMKDLVSIVVPVYNAEKYLNKCISSLVQQTYRELQILLVNDGSIDRSGEMCRQWAEKDPRVTVIDQENHGQGHARNRGVELAKGKYICFVDADDSILPEFIEKLMTGAKRHDADISLCRESRFGKRDRNDREWILNGEEGLSLMFEQTLFDTAPWGKLIRTELVKQAPLPENTLYEDLAGVYKWFLAAQKVVCYDLGLYRYTVNPQGISCRRFDERNFEQFRIIQKIYKELYGKSERMDRALRSRRFSICCKLIIENRQDRQYQAENKPIVDCLRKDAWSVLLFARRKKNKAAALLFCLLGTKGLHWFGSLK